MSVLDLPVRRPVAVAMVFLGIVLLGLVAWQRMPVELFPALEGETDQALWVHRVDQHPNEIANRLAAAELVRFVRARKWVERRRAGEKGSRSAG